MRKTPKGTEFLLTGLLLAGGPQVLLERTVAVVGHRVITLSEVRAEAAMIGVADRKVRPAEDLSPEEAEGALQALVRQTLINNYLDNLGLVPEIPADRMERMMAEMRKRLPPGEVSDSTLSRLLRARIRSEIFAEQHLSFRVTVTEEESLAYYQTEKNRKFLGKPYESVAAIVRADLKKTKTRIEFEKWLETETRRTEVVYLSR